MRSSVPWESCFGEAKGVSSLAKHPTGCASRMLLELFRKVPLRVGEVLPLEADDLLVPQIGDGNLVETSQRIVPIRGQQIALICNGEEA